MEEANRLFPMVRRADDFVDKSSGSVEEREEFPEDFDTYLHTELNWSRLEYDGGDSRVSGWVFWNRQDDRPNTLPVSGLVSENVEVSTDSHWYDKSFLRNLYDAFQELGLHSSDVRKHYEMKYKDEDKEALTTAFNELMLVLESVYEIHKLPLALIWVQCNACDAILPGRLSSNGGEYLQSFMANDNHIVESLIASTGYHLRKGHVAEMVLGSTSMLYCSDVTQFSIAEYPLVLFARQFKLSGCLTVCLRSSYTGEYVYMLEFFLPASSKDNENTLTQVSTILGTMKKHSRTFKLASGQELGEALSVEICDLRNGQRHQYPRMIQASLELLKNGADGMDIINAEQDDTVATISKGGTTKSQERELKKTGVSFDIPLEDVLRFSALSRKNAAMELKVSESTLKRVCRNYGIHRWPPPDLNKEETLSSALSNVGDTVNLDSPKELERDATLNGPHDLHWPDLRINGPERYNLDATCSEEGTITTQKRKRGKTGIRVEISLDDLHKCSKMKLDKAAGELEVSLYALKRICRDYGIPRWPPRKIDKVGAPQPSRDVPLRNIDKVGAPQPSRNVPTCNIDKVGAPQPSRDVPTCNIDKVGTPQPSRVVLQEGISQLTSDMPSNQASNGRDYPIHLGPPQNINKVGAALPSHVEHEEGISQLTYDMPSNQESDVPRDLNKVGSSRPSRVEQQEGTSQLTRDQVSASVVHIQPHNAASREMEMVTIKANYSDHIIKFYLSMSSPSGIEELQQHLSMRLKPLNLEAGNYSIKYKDEEGDLISILCDGDLHDCIHTSRSLGNTTVPIVIVPCSKEPITNSCQ
ncbi:hypothetical protein Vadar_011023 [Vaccinium darrowii]|uniref:Uncharacterized protein n=1 Tax=Vaccinium darrowii TaxID=229202 RepID=A0ACB7XHZ3_9ERIC|nr:hypothetical protein Vadar_011023 [Vaccinium darrowii]